MRFGFILSTLAFASSSLVAAVPVSEGNGKILDISSHNKPSSVENTFDFDLAARNLQELSEKHKTQQHALNKRDDDYISSLLEMLKSSNLLDEFVDKLSNGSYASTVADEVKSAISKKHINASTISTALEENGLSGKFFDSVLGDSDNNSTAIKYAQKLYKAGSLKLTGKSSSDEDTSTESKRMVDDIVSGISKRDADFLTKIVDSISDSGLVSTIVKAILNNKELISAGERLVVSAVKKINWKSLYTTIKNTGIVQSLFSKLVSTVKGKLALSTSVNSKVNSGIVSKETITGGSSVASLAADSRSTASSILEDASDDDSSSSSSSSRATHTTTTASDASASESDSVLGNLIDNFLEGDKDTTTTSSSSTSSTATTAKATSTSGSFLGGIIDNFLGDDDNSSTQSTVAAATTTAATTSSGNFFDGLLGEVFDGSTTTIGTTAKSSSTSTDSFLSNIFDELFDDNDSSNSTSSSSSSSKSLSSELLSVGEKALEKLISGHNSTSSSSSSSKGLGLVSTIFEILLEILEELFDGDSSSSSGSHQGILSEIFDDLFNGTSSTSSSSSNFSLEDVVLNLVDSLFGDSSNSTSSSGSGSSLLSEIIDDIFDSSKSGTEVLLEIAEAIIDFLFGNNSSSSSTKAASTSSTSSTSSSTSSVKGLSSVFGSSSSSSKKKKCCCSGKKKRSPKVSLRKKMKRSMKKAIKKRADLSAMAEEEYLNYFASSQLK